MIFNQLLKKFPVGINGQSVIRKQEIKQTLKLYSEFNLLLFFFLKKISYKENFIILKNKSIINIKPIEPVSDNN